MAKRTDGLIQRAKLDEPNQPKRPLFFFLMGDTGAGKTTSLTTAAKFGRVILIDIDQNAGGLARSSEAGNIDRILIGERPGATVGASEALDTVLRDLGKECLDDPPACVALDSLTSLAQVVMTDVLAKAGRTNQTPQLQDYGIQQAHLQRFCLMLGSLPCTRGAIVIGHTEWDKDEMTGRYIQQLAGIGQKLPAKLLRVFSEIYLADTEVTKDGAPRYVWKTRKTKQYIARTTLGLEDEIPQDFAIPFKTYFGDSS